MTCDQATEYLPWLLNGTLGESERKAVREHLADCERCRQALADTRRAWEVFDQHIPAAALVALAAGDPAGETPEEFDPALLEEHLAACPECAAELELVRTSRGLAEDDSIALLAPRPPRAPAAAPAARPAGIRWRRAAVAAGLAGVIALGGWYKSAERAHTLAARLATETTLRPALTPQAPPSPPTGSAATPADQQRVAALQRRLEEMGKTMGDLQAAQSRAREQLAQVERTEKQSAGGPQINTWVGDIQASGDVVRGGGSTVKEIPAGAAATLLLAAQAEATGERGEREAEISDAGGRIVWKGGGLRANPQGPDYSLTLPKGWLPPGSYTIRLYRRDGGQRVPAESYAIRIK
jgi:anti-sigma factor RsiW